eukprot:830239_1
MLPNHFHHIHLLLFHPILFSSHVPFYHSPYHQLIPLSLCYYPHVPPSGYSHVPPSEYPHVLPYYHPYSSLSLFSSALIALNNDFVSSGSVGPISPAENITSSASLSIPTSLSTLIFSSLSSSSLLTA